MMVAAQRIAVQLPRAHCTTAQNSTDLVREAVGWNGGLGCRIVAVRRSYA